MSAANKWVLFFFVSVFFNFSCSQHLDKRDKIIYNYDDKCPLHDAQFNPKESLFLQAPVSNKNGICSHYRETCCSAAYLQQIQQKTDFLSKKINEYFDTSSFNSKCNDRLEKLACSICSSNQQQFYFPSSGVANQTNFLLCDETCRILYSDCGDARVKIGDKKVKEIFQSGEQFCRELFNDTNTQVGNLVLHVVPYLDGNSLCFTGENECSAHDFYSEPSECRDSKYIIYYKYKTPKTCQGPLPSPVTDLPCDAICAEGSYYSLTNKTCLPCEQGRYSIGGGSKVDYWKTWDSLTLPLNHFCYDRISFPPQTIFPPKCTGWELRPEATDVFAKVENAKSAVLEISMEFIHAGHVYFSAMVNGKQPEAAFRFFIDDNLASAVNRPGVIFDTSSTYSDFEFNVSKGIHLLRWEFGYMWNTFQFGHINNTSLFASIREIHLIGTNYADIQCYKCPPGTYASQSGSQSCKECEPNTYNNERGANQCKPCQSDEYSLDGAIKCEKRPDCTSNDVVATYTPCRSSSTNPDGERDLIYSFKLPIICNTIKYSLPSNATNLKCEACPSGFLRNGTQCLPCADGFYLDNESRTCKACGEGKHAPKTITITTFNEFMFGMTTGCRGPCSLNKGWRLLGDKIDSGVGLNNFLMDSWLSIQVQIEQSGMLKFRYNIHQENSHITLILAKDFRGSSYNVLYKSNGTAEYPLEEGRYTITWSFRKGFFGSQDDARAEISGIWIQGAKGGAALECSPCPSGTYSKGERVWCMKCPAGHTSEPGAVSCGPCPANTYSLPGSSCVPCGKNLQSAPGSPGCHNECKFTLAEKSFDLSPLKRLELMYGPYEEGLWKYFFNLCSFDQKYAECYDALGNETRPFACQMLKEDKLGVQSNVGFSLGSEMHVHYLPPGPNATEAVVINYQKGDRGCSGTRETNITIICDLNGDNDVQKLSIQTKPCVYEFFMRSPFACHICEKGKDNYTLIVGHCDPNTKTQTVHYTWIGCRNGILSETVPCEGESQGYQIHVGVVVVVVVVFVILIVLMIVFAVKYRKLYKSQYSSFQQENPHEIEMHNSPGSEHVKGGLMDG